MVKVMEMYNLGFKFSKERQKSIVNLIVLKLMIWSLSWIVEKVNFQRGIGFVNALPQFKVRPKRVMLTSPDNNLSTFI